MNLLLSSLEFINAKTGEVLPYDEDGLQYTKQYKEFWRVRVKGNDQGKVYLESSPQFELERVPGTFNEWQLTNFKRQIDDLYQRKRQRQISWQEFINKKNEIEDEKKRITGSGYIKAVLVDNGNTIYEQILVISPGNLTEKELNQMIKEIGQLALSAVSCTHYSMEVGESEKFGIEGMGKQWYPGNGLIMRATELLELYQVVKNHWTLLEKRSLKTVIKEINHIRIDKIRQSPKALIKAKLEPHKKMILGFNNIESNNCIENEFICYLLDIYLIELSSLLGDSLEILNFEEIDLMLINSINLNIEEKKTGSTEERIKNTELNKEKIKQFNKYKRNERANIEKINQSRLDRKVEVNKLIEQLKGCIAWSKKARKSKFLQSIKTPQKLPRFSSRLQGSSGYGSIFSKFSNSLGGVLKPIGKVLYLLQNTYEGRIKTTNELYEIWCFIKVYTAFIVYANMRPINNTFLFDKIKINKNEVEIPRNVKYILEFGHNNNYRLVFWYDTDSYYSLSNYKKPDIRIQLLENNQPIKQFCFDAKYKNYSDWDISYFIDDVLGTARDSYYSLLQSKASFLLHPDQKIDYWGEKPFKKLSKIKKHILNNNDIKGSRDKIYQLISDVETDAKGYCGHKYGAIFLRPDDTSEIQIKRILRLILHYHCSFESLCPSCGHQGIEKLYSQSAGRCYSCENCHEFWVITHCQGSQGEHPLVKFKDSFHQKSEPEKNSWLYDCPICGNKFKSQQNYN